MVALTTGLDVRLSRLSRHRAGHFLFVPMDHSVADGPITTAARFNHLVSTVVDNGADAIVVHKGRARAVDPQLLRSCGLIVHLSASTPHAPDGDAKILVGDVADAVRAGADAVSVHVNIGADTEAAQLADLGTVARACQEWNLPLLAMVYPRGPRIADPHVPALLSHVVNIAADLGATMVKTTWAVPAEGMAEVTESCPIPVLVAGGPSDSGSLADYAATALDAGCRGLAVGRRVFESADPGAAVREVAAVVHGHRPGLATASVLPSLATVQHRASVPAQI
ncbi:2-amino-3,7-dideoxy-D-threo-hept-6-ulosonate synthase [Streptomyces olivochromogenes]|uniref:2-amino-3,7-dideoxy-D-threo-hept-6-ulosonate synthase n=1 Tax=Streptomyces olivochromogenes TaxID=1963 RepID=A0A250VQ74_STROL|nr:2-amino-3,7-dideoxy-D-threo-hept-6-ulosonate synthase [Streptomyces olivochromogenes]GAX56130.1 2-amino-3,7-dideoxy-D-threo-hept-6-ulosonate synthase [Streptomyces olivochromogenes]